MIEIIEADALDWLEREAAHGPRFDCIITDPPYWTLNKWAGVGTTARMGLGRAGSGSDDKSKFYETIDAEQTLDVMMAFDNLINPNSHVYVMCDDEVSDFIKAWVRTEKIYFDNAKRLVWDKVDGGMGYHWRATYEFILMLDKGKRRLNDLSRKDVLHHKRVQGKHYPTEKPFGLIEELVLNSTDEGDWVLDPFMGSGVCAEVCLRTNRNFVGIDKSPVAIKWTHDRLNAALSENPLLSYGKTDKAQLSFQSDSLQMELQIPDTVGCGG